MIRRRFKQATAMLDEDQIAEAVVCGPDADRHREAIAEFERAGFDHVYVHQVGPDQAGFGSRPSDERHLDPVARRAAPRGGAVPRVRAVA